VIFNASSLPLSRCHKKQVSGHSMAISLQFWGSKMRSFPFQVAFTAESQNNILIEGVTPGSAPWHICLS